MEKTSFKEFVKDHKGAIIGGVALMTVGYIRGYRRSQWDMEMGLMQMMIEKPEFKDAFWAAVEAKKALKAE